MAGASKECGYPAEPFKDREGGWGVGGFAGGAVEVFGWDAASEVPDVEEKDADMESPEGGDGVGDCGVGWIIGGAGEEVD